MENLIGYIAAFLTTVSFLPQVAKALKDKTKDLSLGMYIISTIGTVFWIIYGFMLNSWPMIIFNIITLGLASTILVIKARKTLK